VTGAAPAAPPEVGDLVDLTVGPVAHGGHCVARRDGLVVFVRHALPGERVVAVVTEARRGYLRADAVRVLAASGDRVPPPCPYAEVPAGADGAGGAGWPGLARRCGGCDLQHVAPPAQRRWKEAVVAEQLRRLAGIPEAEVDALGVRVAALPAVAGQPEALGWRTRVRYAVDAAGRAGLLVHRSHEVLPIDRCRIAHPVIQSLPVTGRAWPGVDAVEAVVSAEGGAAVREVRGRAVRVVHGGGRVAAAAVGRRWSLPLAAFWQVHPAAADALAGAVVDLLRPAAGETAWDLYGGAGLFSAALAGLVGPGGAVTLVESSPAAAAAARENLADLPAVSVLADRVERVLRWGRLAGPVDLVVLDPPRSGAGAAVVSAVVRAGPRAVAYVACDPAAFARDVATFRAAGWTLAALRGLDCFPMTHHIELVGLLAPRPPASGW
jgi:tRNA/tmRNA/rRNA uracil-C5-methylase (TrmA/RlmC/RlmD family)